MQTTGGPCEQTMPIPVVASAVPRRSRAASTRLAVVVAAGVVALLVTATTTVVLAARGSMPSASARPAVTAPAAPAPVATPVVAPAATTEPGPALVDTNGDPVDADLAAVVTRVYRALDANDLEPVRRAYSASGSDDWFTSEPHLRSATIRGRVLAALRERPSAHDGYLYADDGYMIQFGRSDRFAPPGLLSIRGPWSDVPASDEQTSDEPTYSAPVTAAPETPAGQSCADGTVEDPTEGYPCRDLGSGHGVLRDGTAGAHGLRPCPTGTTVPADPNEPTRNAATGEMCGLY